MNKDARAYFENFLAHVRTRGVFGSLDFDGATAPYIPEYHATKVPKKNREAIEYAVACGALIQMRSGRWETILEPVVKQTPDGVEICGDHGRVLVRQGSIAPHPVHVARVAAIQALDTSALENNGIALRFLADRPRLEVSVRVNGDTNSRMMGAIAFAWVAQAVAQLGTRATGIRTDDGYLLAVGTATTKGHPLLHTALRSTAGAVFAVEDELKGLTQYAALDVLEASGYKVLRVGVKSGVQDQRVLDAADVVLSNPEELAPLLRAIGNAARCAPEVVLASDFPNDGIWRTRSLALDNRTNALMSR